MYRTDKYKKLTAEVEKDSKRCKSHFVLFFPCLLVNSYRGSVEFWLVGFRKA